MKVFLRSIFSIFLGLSLITATIGIQNTYADFSITVGDEPVDVAFNPDNGYLYVTNYADNTVTVIDGSTNTVVGSPIAVGSGPIAVAFNPDNGDLYVAAESDGSVTVIDGSTNTVVGSPIVVGDLPGDITFNPDNGYLYVTNLDDDTVSVIDGSTNTVVGSPIENVGSGPESFAFNPTNGYLYLGNLDGDVIVIDGSTNTVVGSPITVGFTPQELAFNPNDGNVYVTLFDEGGVAVIDGTTNGVTGSPVAVGEFPRGIAFNPDNGFMYVTNSLGDTVTVLELELQGLPSYSINDVSLSEGNSGSKNLDFSVTRLGDVSSAGSLEFATRDDTATTSDSDYVSESSTIEFETGETEKTISIAINGDSTRESDEVFWIDLSDCTDPCQITRASGSGTIVNDDEFFISSFVPGEGGNAGEVTIQIFGGGFSDDVGVKLSKLGEEDILAIGTDVDPMGQRVLARFDLTDKSVGEWDLIVTNENNEVASPTTSFTIHDGIAPDLQIRISGSAFIGSGSQRYLVVVTNQGNLDAFGNVVWISVPTSSEWVLDPSGSEINHDTMQMLGFEGEPDDWTDRPYYFESPDDPSRTLIPIFVPLIPASDSVSIPISIKSSNSLSLEAFVGDPVIISPPKSPARLSNEMVELMDAYIDLDSHGLKTVELWADIQEEKGQLYEDITSGKISDEDLGVFTNWWSMVVIKSDSIAVKRCQLFHSMIIGYLVSHLESADIVSEVKKKWTAESLRDWATDMMVEELLEEAYEEAKGTAFGNQIFGDNDKDAWDCMKKHFEKKKATKLVKRVTSLDPNEKAGPNGFGDSPYISADGAFSYTVMFENLDSATAPAQQVLITDNLDSDVFDFSSLKLGSVTFGEHVLSPVPESDSYILSKDLRPEMNLIMRVEAALDHDTGIITWLFSSLDPDTGLPPEDPLVGFLPPNVNSPEGQGSVIFTIMPKEGLEVGTEIKNSASIFFDDNPPIETNEWLNIVDSTPPSISGSPTTTPNANGWYNSDVTVHFDASDSESGIGSVTPDITVSDELPNREVTGTAVDNAGNVASFVVSGINIDKTPPVVLLNGDDTTEVEIDSGPFSDPGATAEDFGYGQLPVTVSGMVDTDTAGSYILTYEAIDLAGNTAVPVQRTVNVIEPTIVTLTPDKDSFLRSVAKNTNEGSNPLLMLQKAGSKRTVISFDLTPLSGEQAESAKLRLHVSYIRDNWGASGRTVDVHKLLTPWVEGNGNNFVPRPADEDSEESKIRGSGRGVTWMCAQDTNISNRLPNCVTKWNGGSFSATKSATAIVTNNLKGQWVEFDVTADVNAYLSGSTSNFGWLIKKTNEGQAGRVGFTSSENPDLAHAPQLVLSLQ